VTLTRRAFLAAAAGAAVTGCSGAGHAPPAPLTTTTSTTVAGAPQPSGDLALAGRAAALENAIATAYTSVLALDRLGTVPAGLKAMWETFGSHHRDHATAWNAILTAAGATVVTTPDAGFSQSVVTPGLAAVKDTDGAIAFVSGIERIAAATYLVAVRQVLTTTGGLQTAAAIQPVELQHVAMLELLRGTDPVPASFATTDGALSLT
jgi:hypothetical protein